MNPAILPYIAWIYAEKALWGNLALSDDRTNIIFGCLICHFVSAGCKA